MEDHQYRMADLRQYINGRPFFPAISQPPDLLSCHRGLTSPLPYDMLMFRSDSTTITPTAATTCGAAPTLAAAGGGFSGFEMEPGGLIGSGSCGDGGTGRWPRQETLTLLEIRSRLDHKFKEANQKGPLWDEVSRIMSEEHGYQRSGKKCREKFENLYKYYKKTKEGKAGRQDGKHYRFFRQLEALYGETSNNSASVSETHFNGGSFQYNYPNNNVSLADNQDVYPGPKLSDTSLISVPNSSDCETASSDCSDSNVEGDTNDARNKKRRGKRSFKAKIRDSIDAQMRKLMEKQEAWMEKMMTIIEHKEQERMLREEQWRKQDAARIDREHKLWASERAWIEARDIALMDAFHKLTGKELRNSSPEELIIRSLTDNQNDEGTKSVRDDIWPENEITRLIQLRSGMDLRFQQDGISEEVLWDEIATKMACYGHDRSGLMCKEKWDTVNNYLLKCNKKRKENSKSCTIYQNHESVCDQGVAGINEHTIRLNDHGNSPCNSNSGDPMNDSCFRYFIGDSYGRL